VSHDALAQNAITLLESILDEQLEYDPSPSEQLAQGLFDLMVDGYENRLVPIGQALHTMTKCYAILNPNAEPYTFAQAEEVLGNR
jgi:hypothetical protein